MSVLSKIIRRRQREVIVCDKTHKSVGLGSHMGIRGLRNDRARAKLENRSEGQGQGQVSASAVEPGT